MNVTTKSGQDQKILELAALCQQRGGIEPELYKKYDVKRGLRDINGKGVLAGLTEISDIHAYEEINGEVVPCEGVLSYQGINIEDIVKGFMQEDRFGFEEVVYLLLFGALPTQAQLEDFSAVLAGCRKLPASFVRDVIMKAPSSDMMNALARSVLTLYSYDDTPSDT